MSNLAWVRIGLTGGTANDLDGIPSASLTDQDIAFVRAGSIAYEYKYDSVSTFAENSPFVIKPDDAGASGRWIQHLAYGINNENQLLNGEFAVNQDAYDYTSSVAATNYYFDGWFNKFGNASHAVGIDADGIKPASGISQLFGRRVFTGSTQISGIKEGETLTASLDIEDNNSAFYVYTGYGSASSSALTLTLAGTATYANPYVQFTADYNSISTNYLAIEIVETVTAGYKLRAIAVTRGTTRQVIQRIPFLQSLADCRFYYQKSYAYPTAPGSTGIVGAVSFRNWDADTARSTLQNLPVKVPTMATTPTATLYSTNTGSSGNVYDATAATDRTVSSIPDLGDTGFSSMTLGTAMPATNNGYFHYVLNARP